jgi:hypothetical protein
MFAKSCQIKEARLLVWLLLLLSLIPARVLIQVRIKYQFTFRDREQFIFIGRKARHFIAFTPSDQRRHLVHLMEVRWQTFRIIQSKL